ncbi:unnamed protein product, partial [Rotaria sp. Silwood1]
WTLRTLTNNTFGQEHRFFAHYYNYLDGNQNHYLNDTDDDDDDDNHIIETLDENDDNNNDACININQDIWCYDNNSRRTSYNNNSRRESYDCLNSYRNVERNCYSINDVNYNDDKNQDNEYSYVNDDFNSIRKYSYTENNQYNNDRNYYGGFLDFD